MLAEFNLLLPTVLTLAAFRPAPRADSIPLLLTRIGLDLKVDYGQGAVRGTARLVLRNTSGHPVAAVPLLLNRLMSVTQVADDVGGTLAFEQQVRVFADDPARQVTTVIVTLPRPLRPEDSLAITVGYGGILVGYTETGSLYIQDHVSYEFTILREDAYAFPVLGVPSWVDNQTIPREPFAFEARITVPADLVVAMGGQRRERRVIDSLATWSYRGTAPVPFLNITIAPYGQLDGPSTTIFHFPGDSSGARVLQQAVTASLGRYESWYGSLPAPPHLVVMEIPEGFGSQASLTAGIIQTADAFRARSELRQLYHELSHLWNVPDLDRPSPRWNEGLATFLQWRMAAELDDWNAWDAQLQRVTQSLLQACGTSSPCNTIPLQDYGRVGETDRSYTVGMLLFYALYHTLGSASFDHAYRTFFQRYRSSGATTAELVAVFHHEGSATDRIFDDWLTTTHWYTRLAGGETLADMLTTYRPQ